MPKPVTSPALFAPPRVLASVGVVTAFLALAWLGPTGCSASPSGTAQTGDDAALSPCPSDIPPACPSPEPSFKDQVQAIVASRCLQCHAPGGQGFSTAQLDTYGHLFAARHDVASQITACRMPLADAGQPTESERQALLGWLVCGAPNN